MNDETPDDLPRLKQRLAEAEATLDAIRDGRVDAVVVEGAEGQQVYTLESADLPYRQFLEHMAEGAVSLDAASTVLYCNRFFSELVGRPRERVLGSSFEALVSPACREDYRAALASDAAQRIGLKLHMPDGRELPVQLALTPLGSGDARRFTAVITDLSERERVRELSAAREAAEAENLAKDQFLAAVGHDLRSPLNVVMGYTTLLLRDRQRFDPRTQRALETIDRNVKLQAKLIEDLLDISRIVSGKLNLERVVVDLGELARSAVAAMALSAQDNGIELKVISEQNVRVLGDPQRLEQVLHNLIGNALKFTPRGGHVQVRVEQADGRARIHVQDDGQGIESALLPRLFQLFRQGDDPQRRRHGGLGLGLSISRHLVVLHEGAITADSAGLGRGALFTITLPALPLGACESPSVLLGASPEPLRGVRVLVVDDQEEMLEITSRTLRAGGAEVVCVSGAAAALARLDHEPFDVIVSDVMMPGTDGLELAREVRERHGAARVMLALSSLTSPADYERALRAGFSGYLTKPLDADRLCRTLGQLLTSGPRAGHGARLQ